MRRALLWIAAAAAAVALTSLLGWAFVEGRAELERERERELPIRVPPRVSRVPSGETVVAIDAAARARIALEVAPVASCARRPEVVASGELEPDPARTFELRAPLAGVLRARPARDWPRVGETLDDGALVADLAPRLGAFERLDLASGVSSTRGEVEAVAAVLSASVAEAERVRRLEAAGKFASERAVQDADAKVVSERARLSALRETLRLLEAAVATSSGPAAPLALRVERGGEVVSVLARPGESVEPGQVLLRIERWDEVLARVELPAGEALPAAASTASIVVLGHDDRPLEGRLVARALVDARTRGEAAVYRVVADRRLELRPGAAVLAHLPTSGAEVPGALVPRSAVVRHAGSAWVFVEVAPDRFARREVSADQPTDDGFFVASGLAPGERVVTSGAQLLLSEELKSQIQVGEDAETK